MLPEATRFTESRPTITPQALLEANRTDKAQENLGAWKKAKERKQGELTLVVLCSDARLSSVLIAGDNNLVASVSTIAANGETAPFKFLIGHPGIGRIIVIGHYDEQKLKEEGQIVGCGGVDAKRKMEETAEDGQPPTEGLPAFISSIQPDSLKQTLGIVIKTAHLAGDKPVYGVAVDHLTQRATPIAQSIVNEKGERMTIYPKAIDQEEPLHQIPSLDEGSLTTEFLEFLQKNQKVADRLAAQPDFIESQKVQNPQAVVLSTSPIPLSLRFPDLFGRPNSAFVVRLPIEKQTEEERKRVRIRKKDLEKAVNQLLYPIEHSLSALSGQSFFDTKTLIIETSSLEESKRIADQIVGENETVKNWILQGGKIIVVETKSGQTTRAEDFKVSFT